MSTKNYYVYKADSKEKTCNWCTDNNNRIFSEEDVPSLPIHPNCKCEAKILRDTKINDSYIEAIKYREFFANDDKILPDERGRYWMRTYTNKANSWLVYSNDGLIFYTYDNGKNFYPCDVSEEFFNWLDDAAYLIRGREKEILTSFGDLSMQVRRIAEVVREDINDLTKRDKLSLIITAEDPQIQIFLVAQHLSDLKNVDFPDKSADELTNDDIIIIANRYSIGPDHDISKATKHDYGYRVINAMEMLLELLE